MRNLKLFAISSLLLSTLTISAQLKVNNSGKVAIAATNSDF